MSVIELDATEALEKLANKEVSAVELVDALIARAEQVDGDIKAFVHRFDDAARAKARQVDDARARGEALGRLAGLPMTIKESMETAGVAATLGLESRKKLTADRNAVVVDLLEKEGAIVIGKTNVPQLLLFHESDNAIWGATNNPFDLERVPGGSSGGEAAAIAAGMSFAGVGTDIGGSIRVPCAFTGTAGLKPTVDVWSNRGSNTALAGQEVVRGQCGPMARTSRDVARLFSAIDGKEQSRRDPASPPLVGNDEEIDLSKLRVGYYEDDGFMTPADSVRRAVQEAVEHLRDAGAELVPFSPPDAEEVIYTYLAALSSDGGKTIDARLGGEAIVPQLAQLRQIAGMSAPIRKAAAIAMGLKGERRVKRLLEVVSQKDVAKLWALTNQRTQIRSRVFDAWDEAGLDAVICPAHATPALRHGDSGDFTLAGCYSMRYNFINFPAGVVPVTTVREDEESRSVVDDRLDRKASKVEKGSRGLPLTVQVVAPPYREHTVLSVMMAIEARARAGAEFPKTPVFGL